jgi:hypothetical protein
LPKTGLTDICEVPAYAKNLAHAADVAPAAHAFGQEDDISALSVTRIEA